MADLPHLAKMLFETLLSVAGAASAAIGPRDGEDAGVVAAADQVLRDDELVGGIVEDARSRASSLPRRAWLGVADIPDDIVVDLVLLRIHLHVDGGADRQRRRRICCW